MNREAKYLCVSGLRCDDYSGLGYMGRFFLSFFLLFFIVFVYFGVFFSYFFFLFFTI